MPFGTLRIAKPLALINIMEKYYSDKIIQMLSDSIFEFSLEKLKLFYSDFEKEKHPLISANKTKGLYKKHLTSYLSSDKQFDLPHFT